MLAAGSTSTQLRSLFPGDAQGLEMQMFGGLGMPLMQQQPAFVPVQLCRGTMACQSKGDRM